MLTNSLNALNNEDYKGSKSASPTRSDKANRGPYHMADDDKRAILKRRGKILDIKEANKSNLSKSSSPTKM